MAYPILIFSIIDFRYNNGVLVDNVLGNSFSITINYSIDDNSDFDSQYNILKRISGIESMILEYSGIECFFKNGGSFYSYHNLEISFDNKAWGKIYAGVHIDFVLQLIKNSGFKIVKIDEIFEVKNHCNQNQLIYQLTPSKTTFKQIIPPYLIRKTEIKSNQKGGYKIVFKGSWTPGQKDQFKKFISKSFEDKIWQDDFDCNSNNNVIELNNLSSSTMDRIYHFCTYYNYYKI